MSEPITIEMLRERIASLEKSKEQLIVQLNMHAGAIEDCNYWLEQLQNQKEKS